MKVPFFLLAFNVGLALAVFLPSLPGPVTFGALLVILGVCLFWRSRHQAMNRVVFLSCACLCGAIWSILWGMWQLHYNLPDEWQKKDMTVVGYVTGLPRTDPRKERFDFHVINVTAGNTDLSGQIKRVRLSWYRKPPDREIRPGQKWEMVVRLKRPHSFMNPGGFDYEAFMLSRGFQASGYIRGDPTLLQSPPHVCIECVRWNIQKKLASLDISPRARGILSALMIGDRSGISRKDLHLLQNNGISHLIAISGLHMTLLGGMIFLIFNVLLRQPVFLRFIPFFSSIRVAALLTLPFIWGYAFVSGFSLPTQRALIMLSVFLVALLFGRFYRPLCIYLAAMTTVLIMNPLAAISAGFYLSFFATAIIMLTANHLARSIVQEKGSLVLSAKQYILSLAAIQLFLGLCLAPLGVFFFYKFSINGFFVNLLAIPLTSFIIMPWLFLNTLLLFLAPVPAELGLQLLASLIDLCYTALEFVSASQWSDIQLPRPGVATVLSICVGVLWLICRRKPSDILVSILFFLPLFFPLQSSLQSGRLEATFLDVGQGLAVHLRTANHQLLYDTGAKFSPTSSIGSSVILPYLRQSGQVRLDRIIVSHKDNDHSGGLADLLPYGKEGMFNFLFSGYKALSCYAGEAWEWDGVVFTVLHPQAGKKYRSRNDRSCVIKITAGKHSLLLTGDITKRVEKELLSEGNLKADILQVPHHGSADSSGKKIVESIQPQYAVFSSGYLNSYGHPSPKIVRRYTEQGAVPITLWQTGAVKFILGGETLARTIGHRKKAKRYWHKVF